MHLCKDCRFHYQPTELFGFHLCNNPNAHYTSPVTGESQEQLCASLRIISADCGPEGKWFEPKDAT